VDSDQLEPEEQLTEEEARRHWLNRVILDGQTPNAVTWDDPSAADAGYPAEVQKMTHVDGEDLLGTMRTLAQRLLDAEQLAAYNHVTKAYLAVYNDDVETLSNEVWATKASLPAAFVSRTVENLLGSLAQMVGLTVQQLRTSIGATTSMTGTGQLRASLGLSGSPNLAGWPTL
jgi:hypothetical protein